MDKRADSIIKMEKEFKSCWYLFEKATRNEEINFKYGNYNIIKANKCIHIKRESGFIIFEHISKGFFLYYCKIDRKGILTSDFNTYFFDKLITPEGNHIISEATSLLY